MVVYLAFLFKLILFKEPWVNVWTYSLQQYRTDILMLSFQKANFTPFASLYYYLSGEEPFDSGFQNIVGNIVLFLPYGVLLGWPMEKKQFKKAFHIMLLTSLGFEMIQFILAYGILDVDDVLLNVFGGSIGFTLMASCVMGRNYRQVQ